MALKKEQLWGKFIKNNPHWLTDGANLTPDGLRKLFETTFDKGHELGLANGKAISNKETTKNHDKQDRAYDFIDKIFGYKPKS